MMIKKCLVVTLIVLSPSLGLAQNTQTTPSVENQNEFKVEFLNQVMGTALALNPMSLKLYDFVFDWIGKPYRFGGTSKNGIDCSAFARELYARVMNQYIPRNSRQQFKYVKPINKEELQTGDLVFFKIKTRDISHVGVYLSDNKFIQSSKSGVNVASLEHPYWKRYYYKAGRL
jgi:murein DD-endopeptidase / murein LD-carboxypeptidase